MRNESGLRPMHFNVVVRMDPVEEVTAGGIIRVRSQVERDELATDEGTLVEISPLAFSYAKPEEWGGERRPAVGDRVLFAQYSGRVWERAGIKYRLLKDEAIVAVIDPPALAAAA